MEYVDRFSGQTQVAFAEAPKEALPPYCRPNFGAAWLTQYKYKVGVLDLLSLILYYQAQPH